MRIEGPGRTSVVAGGTPARRPGASSGFTLPEQPTRPATTTAAAAGIYDVAALMALQAVEGPGERRRKAIRRGFDLLDALDGVRLDLLAGAVAPERLAALVGLLENAPRADDARVDALLEDIELRARVELAKRGRYPD